MPGHLENEIKLRVDSADAGRRALAGLGAELVRPRHLEDNLLFDDAGSSLARTGRALRIRSTPTGGLLTLKGSRVDREGVRTRPELETPVADPEVARAILEELGFRPVFRYQKYREAYRWDGVEIVVDETPIGTFLEIEGSLDSIHAAAAALGRGPADYIGDSYVSLFLAAGGTGDMVF